jgi:hypothetical protein
MARAMIVMSNVTSGLSSGRILVTIEPFLQSRGGPGESAGLVATIGLRGLVGWRPYSSTLRFYQRGCLTGYLC